MTIETTFIFYNKPVKLLKHSENVNFSSKKVKKKTISLKYAIFFDY